MVWTTPGKGKSVKTRRRSGGTMEKPRLNSYVNTTLPISLVTSLDPFKIWKISI